MAQSHMLSKTYLGLAKGHLRSQDTASLLPVPFSAEPGAAAGREDTEAWKTHKRSNQPLRLGPLTLFIASCPGKPFPNTGALRGGDWDLVGGPLTLGDQSAQRRVSLNTTDCSPLLPPSRFQGAEWEDGVAKRRGVVSESQMSRPSKAAPYRAFYFVIAKARVSLHQIPRVKL